MAIKSHTPFLKLKPEKTFSNENIKKNWRDLNTGFSFTHFSESSINWKGVTKFEW